MDGIGYGGEFLNIILDEELDFQTCEPYFDISETIHKRDVDLNFYSDYDTLSNPEFLYSITSDSVSKNGFDLYSYGSCSAVGVLPFNK